jgi:predicted N-acyltransferase
VGTVLSSPVRFGLHFGACYYQTIEFCIARGIGLFEGGAQGGTSWRAALPVAAILSPTSQFSQAVRGTSLSREARAA